MPILRVVGSKRVFPTRDTAARLKANAAKNGFVLGEIRNKDDLIDAYAQAVDMTELEVAYRKIFGRGLPTEEEVVAEMRELGMDVPDL